MKHNESLIVVGELVKLSICNFDGLANLKQEELM
jgi:hypothetical protein